MGTKEKQGETEKLKEKVLREKKGAEMSGSRNGQLLKGSIPIGPAKCVKLVEPLAVDHPGPVPCTRD